MTAISVEKIGKRFGEVVALDGVSFDVREGEIVGFLGPNGAGKTTALRILSGFLAADAGRARLLGIDVAADPRAAQQKLGYLPEGAPLPGEMRVDEYLAHRARLKDVPRRQIRGRVEEMMKRAQISDVRARAIGKLSKGTRQRVGIADALVADPPILILDEPTSGLDPNQIRETRDLLRGLAPAHTVLLSSHILPEVEAVAGRVVILVGGRVVAEDTPGALRGRLGGGGVRFTVAAADVERAAAAVAGAEVVDAAAGRLRVAEGDPGDVARALVEAGCPIVEIGRDERSLEEVFTELTSA